MKYIRINRYDKYIWAVTMLFLSLPLLLSGQLVVDYTGFVDPFIGTGGFGHTFPGPARPFSLVQLGPDTDTTGWDYCAGYRYGDRSIIGFTHTHLSGTGCADLGDVMIMPVTGKLQTEPGSRDHPEEGYRSVFSHEKEKAEVGYYSVLLEDCRVKAEMTSTERVGFHKYTFPTADSAWIVIDLRHRIDKGNNYDRVLDAQLNFEDDSTVSGYVISGGWAPVQYTYFVMRFSKPFSGHGFSYLGKQWTSLANITTRSLVGYVGYRTRPGEAIMVKTGISTTSIEGARKNLMTEIPLWDFSGVVKESKNQWNELLSRVKLESGPVQKKIFYTALYHCFIAPNNIADVDGKYRGVDYSIHSSPSGKYYSTFSLWDTYRALHPLFTLLIPEKVADMVNSMLDHHDVQGFLPIWTLWGTENYCMIGNHAIPVIVDACMKDIEGIDKERAYAAIRQTSVRNHKKSSWDLYQKYKYLPYDLELESVSRTLEMAYDDWCAASLAQHLGKKDDYLLFSQRAGYYRNLFDASTGFFRGRKSDGSWMSPFNPLEASYYYSPYTEGNAWQYSWYVPHDVAGMIGLFGGNARFNKKLDSLFSFNASYEGNVEDMSGFIGQYAHGNEPSHHIAYLYNHSAEPWKTQYWVRTISDSLYHGGVDGLCGNEDCGQMSAWYVFSTLGMYPLNPADGIYQLTSPSCSLAEISLAKGKTLTIRANPVDTANPYIQSCRWNGSDYRHSEIRHSDLQKGGVMEYKLGPKPNKSWIR